MKTSDRVLDLLKKNSGKYISGQQMAEELYVTRASVWKAIKSLEKKGYEIEAITNRGYRLSATIDCLSLDYIQNELEDCCIEIDVLDEVDSTNDEVRRRMLTGKESVLVLAESQSAGRGRRGREFYSPAFSGLYMSLGYRNISDESHVAYITSIAAVSAYRAINDLLYSLDCKAKVSIKWVNDIFIDDKKICGILTESYGGLEDEENKFLIVGWGINVNEARESFPGKLSEIAGSIEKMTGVILPPNSRDILATSIIRYFTNYIESGDRGFIDIYRNASNLIGAYVKINNFGSEKLRNYARVVGINDKCHLLVEYENGTKGELSSGEVSVIKY